MGTQKTNKAMIQNADSTFHVYRLDWTKAKLEFYVDNQLYYTVFNEGKGKDYYPFVAPQFLILNLAIGGNMAGNQIDDTQFPVKMEVDYVRVYQ
jgi:beta-glucanase (GH16 family)